MKLIQIFCVSAFLLGFTNKSFATTYAVVVAIADYLHFPPSQGDLKYTVSDAQNFYNYLRSDLGGKVPQNQMRYLVNNHASKSNITAALRYLFKFAKPEDKVIFYFSGHGDHGAFIPYDFDKSEASTLFHREVKEIFKNCRAKTKICIADACYSGSITQKDIPRNIKSKLESKPAIDVVILMSSRPNETSIESAKLHQGLFSHFLLEGMKGKADKDNNRQISIEELFQFVHSNVTSVSTYHYRSPQHPIAYGHFSRNLVITTY
ncbi:hypothetical protein GCM10028806_35010 [Spirosoma terrae]|uniref:Caspase family protein n=1 Tax=Spirosoma terrae TaxID=1968276 RepID=A0A6L9LG87_9BACT|nr:caspase family protein [Spirosoma terrae]NDU97548.1 caspase family protein [Spirosoma terrae]